MTTNRMLGQGKAVPGIAGMGHDGEAPRRVEGKTAMGRLGQSQEVVGALAFLASDEAAIGTAQTLNVCGGIILS